MVCIGSLDDISSFYDEVWFIVRRLKPYKQDSGIIFKHVPELSPSDELLTWTLNLKRNCKFSKKVFDEEYTLTFLKEMNNKKSLDLIQELSKASKNILLVCYCKRADICHRSIVLKLVEGVKQKSAFLTGKEVEIL